ncbi:MAG TPA: DUF47 family protein [Syntrophobacteraceae bacterium]|nr:DUF47 family protein [Syntrophobacteraceae bacterium]
MAFSLFPRSAKFFDLFIRQSQKLVQAATILNDIFQNYSNVEEKCAQIHILEEEADLISREIARQLSLTFITPIDREDIHHINIAQEEIQNLIDAISTRIGLYGFSNIRTTAKNLISTIMLMINETDKMVLDLSRKRNVEDKYNYVKQLKNDCETLLSMALAEMYDSRLSIPEECIDVIDMIKWTQIYDRIEECVYRTGRLANIIEGITLKNA